MIKKPKQESGFALLMTLIVVSVVLSVGMSMLELSIKQVRLSTNAKDSELAFHSANAGVECARYWRRYASSTMEIGGSISPACFGSSANPNSVVDITSSNTTLDGNAYKYSYSFTWGAGPSSCTQIDTIVALADIGGAGMDIHGLQALLPGYPDSAVKNCEAGARCTIVSVRGYNKACNIVAGSDNFGIVQREVLLEY